MTHYICFQQTQFAVYWALAGLLTYYAGLLPAYRKINTPGSSLGQLPSRIHHDSRQQPEVVSAVPDLVHLPRGDGSPLLVLPESVQLCGVKPTQALKTRPLSKCLASWNLAAGVSTPQRAFLGLWSRRGSFLAFVQKLWKARGMFFCFSCCLDCSATCLDKLISYFHLFTFSSSKKKTDLPNLKM